MNLPNKIVDAIFKTSKDIKRDLDSADLTYNNIRSTWSKLNSARAEFQKQENILHKDIVDYQGLCAHIWEKHRSGVDSADDFKECIVCGKQE